MKKTRLFDTIFNNLISVCFLSSWGVVSANAMKKYMTSIFLALLIFIPQVSNADLVNMSLDPVNVYASAGSNFSIKLNISYDYTDYENMYTDFAGIDWYYSYSNKLSFSYNKDLITLLDVSGGFEDKDLSMETSWLYGVGGTSYTFNFKALQGGVTNIDFTGYYNFQLQLYDPENPYYCDGWAFSDDFYKCTTAGKISVPEPATMLLLSLGLLGLAGARRKIQN